MNYMNHENNESHAGHETTKVPGSRYTLKDFVPLIILVTLITLVTIAHQLWFGLDAVQAMRISMAAFFLIFGAFKVINLAGFAEAYSMYDLLAKKFFVYGYLYPFIEIALGLAYLLNWQLAIASAITIAVMFLSAVGVFIELRKGNAITCACLGTLFKIPMTYVTLLEDLIMGGMAIFMFFYS